MFTSVQSDIFITGLLVGVSIVAGMTFMFRRTPTLFWKRRDPNKPPLPEIEAQPPTRSRVDDAGFDLTSTESVEIPPQDVALIGTGVEIAIPSGWYGRVAPRSGMSVKKKLDVYAGVVDASYRGEVKVCLANLTNEYVKVFAGDRIAQLVITRILDTNQLVFKEVKGLPDSDRGGLGFGSSGN